MAAFDNVLFTDPNVGNQMVRMAELRAQQANLPQATTVAQMNAAQERQLRGQEAQQRNQLQYAALLNQQREQDLVNQRAMAEMGLRKELQSGNIQGQMDLLDKQIAANKELAQLNPFGKGGVDAYLGDAQIRNQAGLDAAAATAEGSRLGAALQNLKDTHQNELDLIERQKLAGRHWWQSAKENSGHWWLPDNSTDIQFDALKQQSQQKFMSDANAIISQAQHTTYDPASGKFVPIIRTPVTIGGMLQNRAGVQPQQPGALDVTQQGAIQPYGPGLNSPFEKVQEAYLNGQIGKDEYNQRRALIDSGQY